ncbi:ABC transporter permease [Nocardiopsis sp. MG754419]|uniref:ABC transporter permease n=1 Tax=Nocardiopsis sp. MG754419 TaxID=2259865 RepID=UPI001BAB0325|nr:ABC transporter permease [Nocardiopsis sp. MG754419]MBR8742620.1 ABC transporter [Nocardiopsis sp. MG754419]
MGAVRAEFLKLKRSLSLVVVIALPVMAVVTGVANTLFSGQQPADGWHTLWLRVVVFYGLFPLTVGLAVLASLVWRVEHQGGNWNALMGRQVSSLRVVLAKTVVLTALALALQVVLVGGVTVAGKVAFDLPGFLPPRYLLVSLVIVVACVPVVALQSALSMVMRSFAAPVAVALPGAVAGVFLLMAGPSALSMALPYGLVGRATQLGTGAFADGGGVGAASVILLITAALGLTAVVVAGATAVLERVDVR